MTRLRGQRGAAATELMAFIPLMIVAALAAWQLLVAATAANVAANAARTGSRAASVGHDGEEAALDALDGWLRDGARAEAGDNPGCDDDARDGGTRIVVCVQVPIVFPGLTVDGIEVRRAAELPPM